MVRLTEQRLLRSLSSYYAYIITANLLIYLCHNSLNTAKELSPNIRLDSKPWCSIKAASKTFIAFSQPKVKFEPSQTVNFPELSPSRIQYPHPIFIELIEWQEIFWLVGPGGERCGRR